MTYRQMPSWFLMLLIVFGVLALITRPRETVASQEEVPNLLTIEIPKNLNLPFDGMMIECRGREGVALVGHYPVEYAVLAHALGPDFLDSRLAELDAYTLYSYLPLTYYSDVANPLHHATLSYLNSDRAVIGSTVWLGGDLPQVRHISKELTGYVPENCKRDGHVELWPLYQLTHYRDSRVYDYDSKNMKLVQETGKMAELIAITAAGFRLFPSSFDVVTKLAGGIYRPGLDQLSLSQQYSEFALTEYFRPIAAAPCLRSFAVRKSLEMAVGKGCDLITTEDLYGLTDLKVVLNDSESGEALRPGDFSGLERVRKLSIVEHSRIEDEFLSARYIFTPRIFEDLKHLEVLDISRLFSALPSALFSGLVSLNSVHLTYGMSSQNNAPVFRSFKGEVGQEKGMDLSIDVSRGYRWASDFFAGLKTVRSLELKNLFSGDSEVFGPLLLNAKLHELSIINTNIENFPWVDGPLLNLQKLRINKCNSLRTLNLDQLPSLQRLESPCVSLGEIMAREGADYPLQELILDRSHTHSLTPWLKEMKSLKVISIKRTQLATNLHKAELNFLPTDLEKIIVCSEELDELRRDYTEDLLRKMGYSTYIEEEVCDV